MTARNDDCGQLGCKCHYAYIRFKKKWIKIGLFHTKCKNFIQFDDIQMSENNNPENTLSKSEDDFYKIMARNELILSKLFSKN